VNAAGGRPADAQRACVVALTGGIASGKGAAAECFGRNSVPVFDADVVTRELVQPGKPALAAIAAEFGAQMLTASGELDRQRMRELVFSAPDERRKLEAILHPRVRVALLEAAQNCATAYCVLVIPLLAEHRSTYEFVNRVLVVDVSPKVQIARLMQRDRCARIDAERLIAAQAPRELRLAIADDVIDNDTEGLALDPVIARLHATYLGIASRSPAET
jgi:dephospho-CoA kinase